MADAEDAKPAGEVLSRLPSTRPQRASARRATGGSKDAAKANAPASRGSAAKARKPRANGSRSKPAAANRAAAGASARATADSPIPEAVRPSAATSRARASGPAAASGQRSPRSRPDRPPQGVRLVGTAVQAAGELAHIGLSVGVQAVRGALSRLPKP